MSDIMYNKLKFVGDNEEIQKLKKYIRTEDKDNVIPFDFNKLTPMPDDIYNGSLNILYKQVYNSDDIFERTRAGRDVKENHNNCYGWRCINWGTRYNTFQESRYNKYKEGLYDLVDEENTLNFATETMNIEYILGFINKLSVKYPNIEIVFCRVLEYGFNASKYIIKNGTVNKIFNNNLYEDYNNDKMNVDISCDVWQTTLEEEDIIIYKG